MKIVVRKSVFETNSSSNHSLIFSNKKRFEIDNEKTLNYLSSFTSAKLNPTIVSKKEDKVYFLGGFFDWIQRDGVYFDDAYDNAYEVFVQVLKDNHDEKLIENLETNGISYLTKNDDEPYCRNYFDEGPLMDCDCGIETAFDDYFENFKYNSPEEYKEKLYKKFKDFIYGDGIVLTYER